MSDIDPLWYKDAVIYEVHVRAFFDSNNDGIGDFPGLTQKLDYLQSLGINCLWLLPFYPSPLRDDGYDIADYENIHPSYGTLEDFERFLDEAHQRGIRVITELVINHTSDQHPWFQAARRAPAGLARARLLRLERHRPEVPGRPHHLHRHRDVELDLGRHREGVLLAPLLPPPAGSELRQPARCSRRCSRSMRFWLDRGVDGLRLDAVPYLIEREGTICENLDETHDVLQADPRARSTRATPDRMLLAEANQWPADVRPVLRRRRRVPHGVPLPADAAHVHGAAAGRSPSDHRDHAADAGHPRELPVGDCSCATTTS